MPIVLAPGLSCSPRLFAPQLPLLWQWGPVTVADTTRHDSIAAIAGAILRDAPPRFVLAGLSMGGYIAFEILRRAPERVIAVALLDTSARPDAPEATENRLRLMELARRGKLQLAVEQNYPRSVHPGREHDDALKRIVFDMAQEAGVQGFLNQQNAIITRADSRPGLPRIRVPALALVGDSDALTPPELAREIAAGIPGARLEVIAGCGHLSTLEQPEAVTQVLQDWLRQQVWPLVC